MSLSYDIFTGMFLEKIREYEFMKLTPFEREDVVDGYLRRAVAEFKKNCMYDLSSKKNDDTREFDVDLDPEDIDEIADIISEGMVCQWLKPYVYQQENLQQLINTRDYQSYSPAELLSRIGAAHKEAQKNYKQMMYEYSYNHGDLTGLHL